MEPPWQLLGRPLRPACRIQGRARELPGPPALPREQGPREVGCQPTGCVSEERGSRPRSPRTGSRSLTRWASYGESTNEHAHLSAVARYSPSACQEQVSHCLRGCFGDLANRESREHPRLISRPRGCLGCWPPKRSHCPPCHRIIVIASTLCLLR